MGVSGLFEISIAVDEPPSGGIEHRIVRHAEIDNLFAVFERELRAEFLIGLGEFARPADGEAGNRFGFDDLHLKFRRDFDARQIGERAEFLQKIVRQLIDRRLQFLVLSL